MKWLSTALLLFMTLMLSSCEQAGSSTPPGVGKNTRVANDVQGEWHGANNYKNQHFDIQITIPEDWHLEKGLNQEAAEIGTDLIAGEDSTKKRMMEAAMKNTQTPFMAYRYPPGTPGKPNPNVICMIEKVSHLPGIKTAADYLLVMEDTMKGSQVDITFEGEPQPTKLGGLQFTQRNQTIDMGFAQVRQRTYARKTGDYVMVFTATILSEADNEVVDELIDTISRFKVEHEANVAPTEE